MEDLPQTLIYLIKNPLFVIVGCVLEQKKEELDHVDEVGVQGFVDCKFLDSSGLLLLVEKDVDYGVHAVDVPFAEGMEGGVSVSEGLVFED